jgi:hypothetical protein
MKKSRILPEDRFWAKVSVLSNGCWLWTGGKSRGGPHGARIIRSFYGYFWVSGKMVRAHRWAFTRWRSPIPPDHDLDHIVCDNSLCVNPSHLIISTKSENSRRNAYRVNSRRKRK